MSVRISSRELNLAAFMKANGACLLAFEGGEFLFDTDKSETQWRVEHSNSCCIKVDNEMLTLKRMIGSR